MIIAALQLKYRKKLFSFLIKTVNVTALIQKKKKKKSYCHQPKKMSVF